MINLRLIRLVVFYKAEASITLELKVRLKRVQNVMPITPYLHNHLPLSKVESMNYY